MIETGNMKNCILVLLFTSLGWFSAQAQEYFPLKSYNPDELISFSRDIPMNKALEILSNYAQRFENRIIIGTQKYTRPIGVSVEKMHWKRALEYILRSNMLKYVEHKRYYEIEPLQKTEEKKQESGEIDIHTREVEINAVFFQADYETLHELGIDWSTLKNGTVEVKTFGASSVAQEFFRVTGSGTINGKVRVDALLKAFESRSRGEIIARPHIRVMEGEQGKIKVGKNFFLTIQDFAGNTRFSEYEAGIILTVTPTIIGKNDSLFIHLQINAERSDVQPDIVGVTKNIAQSRTQVLLLNGEETVIAGLLSHEQKEVRKGVPLLKDLPWWFFGLRYLFGYESKSISKKELVVFIRARIVPDLLTRKIKRFNLRGYLYQGNRDLDYYQNPPVRSRVSTRRVRTNSKPKRSIPTRRKRRK
ncbi:MAG: hypothetical protein D6814_01715 [Calditrichaeota bacterium]|nr:MAG: hypothetical protein D6814_01715 [Calditrichota bacterium]